MTNIHNLLMVQPNGIVPCKLYVSGWNYYGELGIGNTTQQNSPVQVGSDTTYYAGGGGWAFSFASKVTGELYSCGYNGHGQLGQGDTTQRTTITQVGASTDWVKAAGGNGDDGNPFALALTKSGKLYACGSNGYGQLGQGDTTQRTSFTQIGSDTDWTDICINTGLASWAAIKSGKLYTCGYNGYGQLGIGNTTNQTTPVQVGSATDWKQATCGRFFMLAIKNNGDLYASGANNYGQLGFGDGTNRTTIEKVGSLTWKRVAGGEWHSLGVTTDGKLYAWGHNGSYQLGLNDTTQRTSPTQVGSDTDWEKVSAGSNFSFAIKKNGDCYAFGGNGWGTLGLGDTANKTTPTKVTAFSNVQGVYCGRAQSLFFVKA